MRIATPNSMLFCLVRNRHRGISVVYYFDTVRVHINFTMSLRLHFLCFCISFLVLKTQGISSFNGAGSTVNLKTIVLGRCWYYKQFKIPPKQQRKINCSSLWEAFHSGFAYKDPCKLKFRDYGPFFDLLNGSAAVVNKVR